MKKHVLSMTLVLVFVSFILFPASSLSQTKEKSERWIPRGARFSLADFLELTPEQKTKLKEFRMVNSEQRKEFQSKMQEMRKKFRELMGDLDANEKEIKEIYDKMLKLRSGRFSKFIQQRNEFRKIFTPEQLEKLEKVKKRIAPRRSLERGRFFGRRGFSRMDRFSHRGGVQFFRRMRGKNFRGRQFMNRWLWWWRWVK